MLTLGDKIFTKKIIEIKNILVAACERKIIDNNLMGGLSGISLFLFYFAKYKNDQQCYDYSFNLLFNIIENLKVKIEKNTFSTGVSGIIWTIEHLEQNNFISTETNKIYEDLDNLLFKIMVAKIKVNNYDFLHGAIGIGVYFLNREQKNNEIKNYLEILVDYIDEISISNTNGEIKWKTYFDSENIGDAYDLSMSHGIASIIAFLSRIVYLRIRTNKTIRLLNGAILFLLNNQMDKNISFSIFPNIIIKSEPEKASRLAWCYGDLGISVALWNASQALKDNNLENKSLEILMHSTKRRNLQENSVVDAGLCHGTAGIAHIFNRMYINTNILEFKETSEYWFKETLKMAKFKDGLAGYKVWRTKELGGWVNEYGFLEGVAGIGLSLISAVSDIKPKWDEALLLS